MRDTAELARKFVSSSYAQLLLEVAEHHGVKAELLCHECRLPAPAVLRSNVRLTLQQWSRLILKTIALTGNEGLGYEIGLRARLTVHGPLGYALMSQPTFGDSITTLTQYLTMRIGRSYQLELSIEGEWAVLTLAERIPPVGTTPAQTASLRRFLIEGMLTGYVIASQYLLDAELTRVSMHFDWPCPDHHVYYQSRLPPVHFDQPANQIRFHASDLQRTFATADAVAHQQALTQCEAERLMFATGNAGLEEQVRAVLVLTPYVGYPELAQVAARLHMSERTFKRRLCEQGLSFRNMCNEVRQADACKLLRETDLSICEIADWLGYAASTGLIRAFRASNGQTPADFRAETRRSSS